MSRVFSASLWRTKLIRVLATQLVFLLAAVALVALGGCASFGAKPCCRAVANQAVTSY